MVAPRMKTVARHGYAPLLQCSSEGRNEARAPDVHTAHAFVRACACVLAPNVCTPAPQRMCIACVACLWLGVGGVFKCVRPQLCSLWRKYATLFSGPSKTSVPMWPRLSLLNL